MEAGMIMVDQWRSGSQAYFLTHLHSDHTVGLTSTWNHGPLFCSRITARLFRCKFPGFNLSLLRVLDIGTWHSLSLTIPSSGKPTTLCVRAIDAHHCPGSVMYIFRGEFGCTLYTGDFRWEKNSNVSEYTRSMLLDALKNEKLNTIYLDNTYCNPRYSFPSREVAARQIVDIINSHPNHQVIIGIHSLGKEDLLLDISRELKMKIWVWPERLQIMHILGFRDIFTTKTSLTRVRAVPQYSFSIETLQGLNRLCPTIGIMPSGLPWVTKRLKGNKSNSSPDISEKIGCAEKYHEFIYTVPYSDHSCFSEIQEFVELLRPIDIKGTVPKSSCCIDPLYYFGHLCGTEQAVWRIQQKLEEEVDRDEATDAKLPVENTSNTSSNTATSNSTRRKRSVDHVDFFGIRIKGISSLRRSNRGAKISDI